MRLRRSALALVAAAAMLLPLSACASAAEDESSESGASRGFADFGSEQATAPEPATAETEGPGSEGADDPSAVVGSSIVSTGDLALVVTNPGRASEEVAAAVRQLGGYVESQTVNGAADGGSSDASLVVRVPVQDIDAAFTAIGQIGEVTSRSQSASDVTAAHVDLTARVAALEASVTRLSELMSAAASTSDLLEAESALSARQQELDGLQAQLNALESQVNEATISVSLTTRNALPGGGPANFWEGLFVGFDSISRVGAGTLVLAGILFPWLALGALVALAVLTTVRASRRRAKRGDPDADSSATAPQIDVPEETPTAPPGA